MGKKLKVVLGVLWGLIVVLFVPGTGQSTCYDDDGNSQIYAARSENGRWQITKVSDWDGYRWDFGGGGSTGGCAGLCGGDAGGCFCDSQCHDYGDCCSDVCAVCGFCG